MSSIGKAADTLRPELPPLPERMTRLALDRRGYPVPWFVPWLRWENDKEVEAPVGEGRPEFRLMGEKRIREAIKFNLCWTCGQQLGRFRGFVIGPMCLVNRINGEPPSHVDCADFAARACPFLARPHARRRENGLPEDLPEPAGVAIRRNPGVACVYIVEKPARIKHANGILFELPEPRELRFYAEGRAATYEEVSSSVETGLPALLDVCETDEERAEVYRLGAEALARWVAPVLLPGAQSY